MKCTNCGYEQEQSFQYCPTCGAEAPAAGNPAAERILSALKDPLFLVICILSAASCIFSISNDGLPLIAILQTVFLWLTYAQSRKDIADAKHLRCISGTVYANYVILYVVAGLFVVVGMICAVAFGMLAGLPAFLNEAFSAFADGEEVLALFTSTFAGVTGWLLMIVFVLTAAVLVVLNIFTLRYVHRFAKSVYQSIETGVLKLDCANATRIWLFIAGGISALGILSSLAQGQMSAGLGNAVGGANAIISGILIGKYLPPEE